MTLNELIAIDVHTHAEVSCRQEPDDVWQPFEAAAGKYFKTGKRPTIAETVAYYRERKLGLVMFTVDSEFQIGAKRIPNEEVAPILALAGRSPVGVSAQAQCLYRSVGLVAQVFSAATGTVRGWMERHERAGALPWTDEGIHV
jgi:hypothetical protein